MSKLDTHDDSSYKGIDSNTRQKFDLKLDIGPINMLNAGFPSKIESTPGLFLGSKRSLQNNKTVCKKFLNISAVVDVATLSGRHPSNVQYYYWRSLLLV